MKNNSGEVIIGILLLACIPLFLSFYHERQCLKQDAIDRAMRQTNTIERIEK